MPKHLRCLILVMWVWVSAMAQLPSYSISAYQANDSPLFLGVAELVFHNKDSLPISEIPLWVPAGTEKKKRPEWHELDPQPGLKFIADSLRFFFKDQVFPFRKDPSHPQLIWVDLQKDLPSGNSFTLGFHFALLNYSNSSQVKDYVHWHPILASENPSVFQPDPSLPAHAQAIPLAKFTASIKSPKNLRISPNGYISNAEEWYWLQQVNSQTEKTKESFEVLSTQERMTAFASREKLEHEVWYKKLVINQKKSRFLAFTSSPNHMVFLTDKLGKREKLTVISSFSNQYMDTWFETPEFLRRAIPEIEKVLGPFTNQQVFLTENNYSNMGPNVFENLAKISSQNGEINFQRELLSCLVQIHLNQTKKPYHPKASPWLMEGLAHLIAEEVWHSLAANLVAPGTGTQDFAKIWEPQRLMQKDYPVRYPLTRNHLLLRNIQIEKVKRAFSGLYAYISPEDFNGFLRRYWYQNRKAGLTYSEFQSELEKRFNLQLNWLFISHLKENAWADYSIEWLHGSQVLIKNKNQIPSPLHIQGFFQDQKVLDGWFQGFSEDTVLDLKAKDLDQIWVNIGLSMPDENLKDNMVNLRNSLVKKRPFSLQFIGDAFNPRKDQWFWGPALRLTAYDGMGFGLNLSNSSYPRRPIYLSVSPVFSLNNKEIIGSVSLGKRVYHQGKNRLKEDYKIHAHRFTGPDQSQWTRLHFSSTLSFQKNYESPWRITVGADVQRLQSSQSIPESSSINFSQTWMFRLRGELKLNHKLGYLTSHYQAISNGKEIRLETYGDLHPYQKLLKGFKGNYYLGMSIGQAGDLKISPMQAEDFFFDHLIYNRFKGTNQYIPERGRILTENDLRRRFVFGSYTLKYTSLKYIQPYSQIGIDYSSVYLGSGVMLSPLPNWIQIYFPLYSNQSLIWQEENYLNQVRFALVFNLEERLEQACKRLFY